MPAPFERYNARFTHPVNLRARFFQGSVLADPAEIVGIEIWRGGQGTADGGVLVDYVDGSHAIQDGVGQFRIIYDAYVDGSPGSQSPLGSPGVQGPGSPNQAVSPNDPAAIVPQVWYYDVWKYRETTEGPIYSSEGLRFYLYPDTSFIDSGFDEFRFEAKPDRKRIVKGERIDIRFTIIPVPLYRARREPLVDYLLPLASMRARIIDAQNNEVQAWTDLVFTGQVGILRTETLSAFQLGEYLIQLELMLPNGDVIRYPKLSVMLID